MVTIECRRYPPQIVEKDKWIPGHENIVAITSNNKRRFPDIEFETSHDGIHTKMYCGEYAPSKKVAMNQLERMKIKQQKEQEKKNQ